MPFLTQVDQHSFQKVRAGRVSVVFSIQNRSALIMGAVLLCSRPGLYRFLRSTELGYLYLRWVVRGLRDAAL